MKYKNVSGTNVQLAIHRFLDPNAVVDFDDNDLKMPIIKSAIYEKGWLIPVIENIAGDVIQDVVNTASGIVPPPQNADINVNINIDLISKQEKEKLAKKEKHNNAMNAIRQQIIDEAIAKSEKDKKSKGWNPMDYAAPVDEEFGDYFGPKQFTNINSKTDYGNIELTQNELPTVHAGHEGIGQTGYLMHHPDDISEAQKNPAPMKQENDIKVELTTKKVSKVKTKKSPK